jgi:predicted RND superfamily exporter protein
MAKSTNKRAYICKVENLKARTSSSKEYFSLYVEDGKSYLFTATDLSKAETRAKKNKEDVVSVSFDEPEPNVKEVIKEVEVVKEVIKEVEVVKEVIKEVEVVKEVPQKGVFGKLFGGMFS